MIQSTPKLSKAKAPVLTIARSFLNNNMMCNAINILADTII